MTIWNQVQKMSRAVRLDVKDESYYIYKGLRITEDNKIYQYNIHHQLDLLPRWVHHMAENKGLKEALHEMVKQKYKKELEVVEARIKLEIATTNNHKRLTFLKSFRKNCLIKYSEL